MHELSIATALIELVRQHAPPGCTVRSATVCAGPLRAIEPDAMQFAWQAATDRTELQGSKLHLTLLPWKLHCPQCNHQWDSEDPLAPCRCGCEKPHVTASNELMLMELDVDEQPVPSAYAAFRANQQWEVP